MNKCYHLLGNGGTASHHHLTMLPSFWLALGVDTRALTKKIREQGTMLGWVVCEGDREDEEKEFVDPNTRNLASEVSRQVSLLIERF